MGISSRLVCPARSLYWLALHFARFKMIMDFLWELQPIKIFISASMKRSERNMMIKAKDGEPM
jgi:hypothetical protein